MANPSIDSEATMTEGLDLEERANASTEVALTLGASAELATEDSNLAAGANLYDKDDYCDVTFLCQDGKRVRASRTLLMGRSNFFKIMLTMETDSGHGIAMHTVSSLVLRSVIEHIYTGQMVKYPVDSSRRAFEIISAAILFHMPQLEGALREVLLYEVHMCNSNKSFAKAAAILSVALEFPNLLEPESGYDSLVQDLVILLSSNWIHSSYASELSEEALHYLLSETRTKFDFQDDGVVSLDLTEYYRLRQIVFWRIYQDVPGWTKEAEERVESAMPLVLHISEVHSNVQFVKPRVLQMLLSIGSSSNITAPSFLDLRSVMADEASRELLMKMLSNIDLLAIPSILLAEVVIPLNLFPPLDLLKVCQQHLIRKRIQCKLLGWNLGAAYRSPHGTCLIQKTKRGMALALASVPMSKPSRVYTWYISVEQRADPFMEFGFIFREKTSIAAKGHDRSEEIVSQTIGSRLSRELGKRALVLLLNFAAKTVLLNYQLVNNRHRWQTLEKDSNDVSKIIPAEPI